MLQVSVLRVMFLAVNGIRHSSVEKRIKVEFASDATASDKEAIRARQRQKLDTR